MNDRELREVLREGDPLDAETTPTELEFLRMRQRAVAVAERSDDARYRVSWTALAATGALALLLVTVWSLPLPLVQNPSPAQDEDRQPRRIQFDTPGGTRVVWVLDPDFQESAANPPTSKRRIQ